MSDSVPFPELTGSPTMEAIAVAPDERVYVVPSGTHERLQNFVVEDSESRDPSVDLALAGWAILRCDGLTDRVNADVPDDFTDASVVRRFAERYNERELRTTLANLESELRG